MTAPGAPAAAQSSAPSLPAEALAKAGGPFVSNAAGASRHLNSRRIPRPSSRAAPTSSPGGDSRALGHGCACRRGRLYTACHLDPVQASRPQPASTSRGARGDGHRYCRRNLSIGQPAGGAVQKADQPVEVVQRGVQAVARLRRPVGGLVVATLRPEFPPACSAEARVVSNQRWQPGLLFIQMRNANAVVRREAAYGIVVKLSETDDEQLLKFALIELRACLDRETSPDIQACAPRGLGCGEVHPTTSSAQQLKRFWSTNPDAACRQRFWELPRRWKRSSVWRHGVRSATPRASVCANWPCTANGSGFARCAER